VSGKVLLCEFNMGKEKIAIHWNDGEQFVAAGIAMDLAKPYDSVLEKLYSGMSHSMSGRYLNYVQILTFPFL